MIIASVICTVQCKGSEVVRLIGSTVRFFGRATWGELITELYGNKNNRGVLKVMRKLQNKKPKVRLKIYLVIYILILAVCEGEMQCI